VEIEIQANDLRHIRDTVLRLIADDTGQPLETVYEDSLHDHWYTAKQALEFGFIDHVVQSFDQVMPLRRSKAEAGAVR
jgi:ATP-dependent Clp protease protease subunit